MCHNLREPSEGMTVLMCDEDVCIRASKLNVCIRMGEIRGTCGCVQGPLQLSVHGG